MSMYEDVNDDDVLLWACFDCGMSGAITRPPAVEMEDVKREIRRAHEQRMPGCDRQHRGSYVRDFSPHDWLRKVKSEGAL